jgi:hypothetical protein
MALDIFTYYDNLIEQIFIYFIYRVYYFQTFVLIPQLKSYSNFYRSKLQIQIQFLNLVISAIVLAHIGLSFLDYFMLFGVNIFIYHFL